jgi:hypothetical protein
MAGVFDQPILEVVNALWIDVSELRMQLVNGVQSDATTAYKELLRGEMANALADIVPGLLQRLTPSPRWIHRSDIRLRASISNRHWS